MVSREHQQRDIALAQLHTALRLYRGGDDGEMFSALTLAGAAEEILGKELTALGQANALDTDKAATDAVSRALGGQGVSEKRVADIANRARNAAKHLDAGGRTVWMDPRKEARDMLDRAVTNYFLLTEDQTDLMMEFLRAEYAASGS